MSGTLGGSASGSGSTQSGSGASRYTENRPSSPDTKRISALGKTSPSSGGRAIISNAIVDPFLSESVVVARGRGGCLDRLGVNGHHQSPFRLLDLLLVGRKHKADLRRVEEHFNSKVDVRLERIEQRIVVSDLSPFGASVLDLNTLHRTDTKLSSVCKGCVDVHADFSIKRCVIFSQTKRLFGLCKDAVSHQPFLS